MRLVMFISSWIMNYVKNVRIEEIVEIICEFVKHSEKVVVDNEKL